MAVSQLRDRAEICCKPSCLTDGPVQVDWMGKKHKESIIQDMAGYTIVELTLIAVERRRERCQHADDTDALVSLDSLPGGKIVEGRFHLHDMLDLRLGIFVILDVFSVDDLGLDIVVHLGSRLRLHGGG